MKRIVIPLLIVLAGIAAAALLIISGPSLQPQPAQAAAPLIKVATVNPQTIQLHARTHGTVTPRTESELVPEVDGRVVEISPNLVSGGFFRAGDMLMRIEKIDYEVAVEQARAGLARAQSDLENARKTHARQLDLVRRGATSDAQRDDALNRVRIAEATLRETEAKLSRARRDLARTEVLAPYDGRVRNERVDVGQFVKRGTPIGNIYAVDFAEVRLPIQDEELAFLNLPLNGSSSEPGSGSPVTLRARFAGAEQAWQGEVVRTEGELDPATRMVHVVARVADPYGRQPPLSVGLFVNAEISGTTVPNLVRLPRIAIRNESQVLVVETTADNEHRLWLRDVTIMRREHDQVLVSEGLKRGERVCVSPLQTTTDGMLVRIANEPESVLAQSGQLPSS